ncbi:MAG: AAA family ATPase [Opitutales bacterium]|nr:AAA family ATPase [Opitutales bacterium]
MSDIQEIMHQFDHGRGNQWMQFVNSITVDNIHGWTGQEIKFRFPVVAIVGANGVGKSTFLKAAACAYQNEVGKTFYPSKVFMSTRWDEGALSNATITYNVRIGTETKKLRWKKTNDWGFSPKTSKPKRSVYFLDISRTLPLDATAGYAKIAKTATEEAGRGVELDNEHLRELSYVLGQEYSRARFTKTNVNTAREVGLLTNRHGEISQFHQGAGEDSMLDVFKLLQRIKNQSLLIIDEVENSLHPQAQRRFIRYLIKLARVKKLQIILSTHSPFVLDELPPIARIMLVKLSDRKDILYEVSTEYALSTIDDVAHPELQVYLEDKEANALFWEIIKIQRPDCYRDYCNKIKTTAVGSYDIVNTLDSLAKNNKLPFKSLSIVDGDKKDECPNCLAFPGSLAPEKQVMLNLKSKNWAGVSTRFGIGSGSLYSVLDEAILNPDHHCWTTEIGNKIMKSKDEVWSILIEIWVKECLSPEEASVFVQAIDDTLDEIR